MRHGKAHLSISEDQALENARPLGSVQEVKPVEPTREAGSISGALGSMSGLRSESRPS